MAITRRRLCATGAGLALVGASGCLDAAFGGGSEDAVDDGGHEDETSGGGREGDDSTAGGVPADLEGDLADWAWAGDLPVESAVQHHDPSCGCCSQYVPYLEAHGIDVVVEETDDLGAVKADLGVPRAAASCHTVEVDGYLVEGHVPLEAVDELLATRPDVLGIAAPGMPRNAPGMGARDGPLAIYAFDGTGAVREFLEA